MDLPKLTKAATKELAKTTLADTKTFIIKNKRTILTAGSLIFEYTAIYEAVKQADTIHDIIADIRYQLDYCKDADRKQIIHDGMRRLARPVSKIFVPALLSTICIIKNDRDSKKVMAEYAAQVGALTAALDEYKIFEKNAKEELGEERYAKIKADTAIENFEFNGYGNANVIVRPGEFLCYMPDFGVFFSSTEDKIDNAFEHLNNVLKSDGSDGKSYGRCSRNGHEVVTYEDIFDELSIPTPRDSRLIQNLGFEAGRHDRIGYYVEGGTVNGVPHLVLVITTEPAFV